MGLFTYPSPPLDCEVLGKEDGSNLEAQAYSWDY